MTYKYEPTLQDKTSIYQEILGHTAECNKVDWKTLEARFSMSRRQLRKIVSEINSDSSLSWLIAYDPDEGGCWAVTKGSSPEAVANFYWHEKSREIQLSRKNRVMQDKINAIMGRELLDPAAKLQGRLPL